MPKATKKPVQDTGYATGKAPKFDNADTESGIMKDRRRVTAKGYRKKKQ